MMRLMRRLMSIFYVLITISAWLSISNHCALGAAVPDKPKVDEGGCPFHAKTDSSQKGKPQTNGSPCCKVLRAVAVASAKHVARSVIDLASTGFEFASFFFHAPPRIALSPFALDTGPPGKTSFVELNRSMRAHAPPFLA